MTQKIFRCFFVFVFSYRDSFLYTVLSLCVLFNVYQHIFLILKAREEEMTAKVMDLQTQLEELQKKYQQRLQQEENPGNDKVSGTGLCVTFLENVISSF